jgi:hypothetical protein
MSKNFGKLFFNEKFVAVQLRVSEIPTPPAIRLRRNASFFGCTLCLLENRRLQWSLRREGLNDPAAAAPGARRWGEPSPPCSTLETRSAIPVTGET